MSGKNHSEKEQAVGWRMTPLQPGCRASGGNAMRPASWLFRTKHGLTVWFCLFAILCLTPAGTVHAANVTSVSASPNPFANQTQSTTISYTLGTTSLEWLRIFNNSGVLKRKLVNPSSFTTTNRTAGAKNEVWDGKDDSAVLLPDGNYNYRIDSVYFVSKGGQTSQKIDDVAVNPSNANTIWATSDSDGKLYKSTNGGSSWTNSSYSGNRPRGIAITSSGATIWVADQGDGRVYRSTDSGSNWSNVTWGSASTPWDVAVTDDGSVAYGVDTGTNKVYRYSGSWSQTSAQPSGISNPTGVAVHPTNSAIVYVADDSANKVWKSTDSGASWAQFATQGTGSDQYNDPYDVEVDANGNVWISDKSYHRVQQFDSSGTWIMTMGGTSSGTGNYQFDTSSQSLGMHPVTISGETRLYVADCNNKYVKRYTYENWTSTTDITISNDSTAPAAVTLSTGTIAENSIQLTWTSPGDDNSTGTATTYDIRYSTSAINDGNWAGATQVSGEPAPLVAGTSQSHTVTGLTQNTTYYFAIKTADEVPNWSGISNSPSATALADTTAPASVTLSTGTVTVNSVELTWTAPGDDNNTAGTTATSYDVRYRTDAAIDASNWGTATQATGEPAPDVQGTAESFTVTGLSPSTTYYFAIKTGDEVVNWSGLSNSPSATTPSGDGTPPADIIDLGINSATNTSITLAWTSPGDDGSSGTATTYDIRYSTSPINAGNWASATQATGEPAPQAAGTNQTFTVNSLSLNTTYYFAMKTSDEVPNTSGLSNLAVATTTGGCDVDPNGTYIEAENFSGTISQGSSTFSVATAQAGYNGTGYLLNGSPGSTTTPPTEQGKQYYVNFPTTGTYKFWMRGYGLDGTTDSLFIGLDGTWTGALNDNGTYNQWVWSNSVQTGVGTITVSSSGYHNVNIWVREASHKVDGIYLTTTATTPSGGIPSGAKVVDPTGCQDTTAPASVTLSTGTITNTSVQLNWTAPGDDNSSGTTKTYDIRYSTSAITAGNWASATQAGGEPTPSVAGTSETFTVTGLSPGTTYYFAIKTGDEVPNWSTVSNSPSATTYDPPVGGYTSDNVIPTAQVTQATDGTGVITITWKGRDNQSDNVTLKTFEYSVDGGSTWNAPTNADASASLSTSWTNNGGPGWTTAATFGAATSHSFTFNTKHADVTGLNGVDQSDVRVRFKLRDATMDSLSYVTSENFRADNLVPTSTITSASYNSVTDTLTITGTNFTTIANAGTDIKSYVDWTKFVWDINGDDAVTANITFVVGDVTSLTVTNGTTLTLVFTGTKGTAIEATAGYSEIGGSDTIDVTAGFVKDAFGNVATTDARSDGVLNTIDPPVGGYTADNVIPTAQVTQATNGSGLVTITFKGRDNQTDAVTLKTFEYSVDGGSTWNAPVNGDASASLSTNWADNGGPGYDTALTLAAATSQNFTFNTKHSDVSGINGVDQSDVQMRFKLNDGTNDSGYVTSQNFRVDDLAPTSTISSAGYNPDTDTLTITGTNFDTIAAVSTDIKTYVDWTKFVWDINGDNATTANITFVVGDVTSLTITNATTLTLVFTAAKGTAIEATAGYGVTGGVDTLDVTAGFIKDAFGNAATTDGVADGSLLVPNYQPDAMVKLSSEGDGAYLTDNTYEATASAQAKSQGVVSGSTAAYSIKFQNDANVTDSLVITGTATGSSFTVQYLDDTATDRTADVTGAGYTIASLAAGASKVWTLNVTPAGTVAGNTSFNVYVTTTSATDGTKTDQVKATTSSTSAVLTLLKSADKANANPGEEIAYTVTASNGAGLTAASSVVMTDPIPANTGFKIAGATFNAGTSTLTNALSYSDDGGSTWTYTPASGGCSAPAGYDYCVNKVKWTTSGNMPTGTSFSIGLVVVVK